MKNRFKQISVIVTLTTVPISLSLQQPAYALFSNPLGRNQFDVCVREMVGSGVENNDAGEACSDALIPKELSKCVVKIRRGTPISAGDALEACYQVRRPIDLANCVVDIHKATPIASTTATPNPPEGDTTPPSNTASPTDDTTSPSDTPTIAQTSPSLLALDSCRRSLLPGRYSECVIALSRNGETASPIAALNTCLSAEDFPRDLFPAYNGN